VFATAEWIETHTGLLTPLSTTQVHTCTGDEIKKVSNLNNPPEVLLICHITDIPVLAPADNETVLILDDIQDPGNMGTIIRTADWMGVKQIICHTGCVDIYNAKVVQATMGSLLRVKVVEADALDYLAQHTPETYAAELHGQSLFETTFHKPCALIIGNEGNGIQPAFKPFITQYVTIPGHGRAESLNAAIAAGIILAVMTK
jgi:TrmH family RNA methyltransferase